MLEFEVIFPFPQFMSFLVFFFFDFYAFRRFEISSERYSLVETSASVKSEQDLSWD